MSISPGHIDESERRFSPEERRIAEILAREGRMLSAKAEVNYRRIGDAIVDGVLVEFKNLATTTADSETIGNTVNNSIRRGGQARHIIIDARRSGLTEVEAIRGLARVRNITRGMMDSVRIIGDGFDVASTDFQ